MKKFALLTAACLLAAAWAQESKPTAKPAAAGAKYWNTDQGKWSDSGTFYLESPGVFDIHLVDDKGNELNPKSAKAEPKK